MNINPMNSNFDEFIKQKLESIEAPFAEIEWEKFNHKLATSQSQPTKASFTAGKLFFLFSAVVLGIVTTVITLNPTQKTTSLPEVNSVVASNTLETAKESTSELQPKANIIAPATTPEEEKIPADKPTVDKVENRKGINSSSTASSKPETNLSTAQLNNQNQIIDPSKPSTNIPSKGQRDKNKPELSLSKNIFCTGESIEVEISKLGKGDKVKIDWNDGSSFSSTSHTRIFSESGFYNLEANVYNADGELYATLINDYPIVVNPSPELDIAQSLVSSEFYRPNYTLTAISNSSIQNIIWKINGKMIGNGSPINYAFNKKGDYNIELTASGTNGCLSKQTTTHQASEDYNLLAANSFSPNGDSRNEMWLPVALNDENLRYEIEIRDRSNNVVFKGSDKDRLKWDGAINGGKIAANGEVFSWVATVQYSPSEVTTFNGVIIISR